MVISLYKEPVYQIVEKIKNESYFRCPNKISGDVTRRNQSLYCSYHWDYGHTTEDCRTLRDHLRQLEKLGYLAEFLVQDDSHSQGLNRETPTRTSTSAQGIIKVIHVVRKWVKTRKTPPKVLAVNLVSDIELEGPVHKKSRLEDESIDFTRKDLMDTIQLHKDALVVTPWIEGFNVKRVMIDQGNGAEIMYPDLYEGLGLTPKDLTKYDSPLVAFDGSIFMLAG